MILALSFATTTLESEMILTLSTYSFASDSEIQVILFLLANSWFSLYICWAHRDNGLWSVGSICAAENRKTEAKEYADKANIISDSKLEVANTTMLDAAQLLVRIEYLSKQRGPGSGMKGADKSYECYMKKIFFVSCYVYETTKSKKDWYDDFCKVWKSSGGAIHSFSGVFGGKSLIRMLTKDGTACADVTIFSSI